MEHTQYRTSERRTIYLAESGFFARPLRPETKQTINAIMRAVYWGDQLLDNCDVGDKSAAISIRDFLSGKTTTQFDGDARINLAMSDLKRILDNSRSTQRNDFFALYNSILSQGRVMRTTLDASAFISARKKEGRAAATIFLTLAPELGQNKPFANFYPQITATGNLLDSFYDASQDKKRGQITINPYKLRFRLVSEICKETVKTVNMHDRKFWFTAYCIINLVKHFNFVTCRFVKSAFANISSKRSPS